MTESTQLVPVETVNPVDIFDNGGWEPLLERIEKHCRSIVPDISTQAGRDAITSLAYKVARSKTALDAAGKEHVAGLKKKAGETDATRRIIRERLDALRDEVRKPVTELEEAQEHSEQAILAIRNLAVFDGPADSEAIKARQAELEESARMVPSTILTDYNDDLDAALEQTRGKLETLLADRLKIEAYEAQQAEEARKQAEREREAREAEIARTAAEKARKEAEEQAARDAEAARQKAERERQEAVEAERRKAEAAQRERDEQARKEREASEAEERQRQREADEQAAREKDRSHRKGINAAAKGALVDKVGLTEEQAQAVVEAIIRNRIPNITISY